jgi:hypothetical protein
MRPAKLIGDDLGCWAMSATTHLMASSPAADHTACGRLLTARLGRELYFNHSMAVIVVTALSIGKVTCSRCLRHYQALETLTEDGSQHAGEPRGDAQRRATPDLPLGDA